MDAHRTICRNKATGVILGLQNPPFARVKIRVHSFGRSQLHFQCEILVRLELMLVLVDKFLVPLKIDRRPVWPLSYSLQSLDHRVPPRRVLERHRDYRLEQLRVYLLHVIPRTRISNSEADDEVTDDLSHP